MFDRMIGRWATVVALIATVGLVGCDTEGDEAEMGEVPEVAEVEPEDTDEGEVDFQEALPLTVEDVGDVMLVTGTVIGTVLPNEGFFVATEHGEVLFVESAEQVTPGQLVTVTGPLQSAEVPVFDEWEMEALQDEIEAEWEMMRTYYIEAGSVATP